MKKKGKTEKTKWSKSKVTAEASLEGAITLSSWGTHRYWLCYKLVATQVHILLALSSLRMEHAFYSFIFRECHFAELWTSPRLLILNLQRVWVVHLITLAISVWRVLKILVCFAFSLVAKYSWFWGILVPCCVYMKIKLKKEKTFHQSRTFVSIALTILLIYC